MKTMKTVLQRSRKNTEQRWRGRPEPPRLTPCTGQPHACAGTPSLVQTLAPLPTGCLHLLQPPVFILHATSQPNHGLFGALSQNMKSQLGEAGLEEYHFNRTSTEVKGPLLFSQSWNACQHMPHSSTFPVNGTTQMPCEKSQNLF